MYKHTYFNPQYKTTQSNTQTLKTENSHSKHTHTIHVIPSAFPSMKKLSTRIISLSRARYHKCFMYFFSCTRTLVYIFLFYDFSNNAGRAIDKDIKGVETRITTSQCSRKTRRCHFAKGPKKLSRAFFFSSVLYYFRLGKGFRAN